MHAPVTSRRRVRALHPQDSHRWQKLCVRMHVCVAQGLQNREKEKPYGRVGLFDHVTAAI